MTHSSRRLILFLTASAIALAALIASRVSTAQTGVTWTNRVNANTSGSGLTPTAANGRGESSQSIPAGNGTLKVFAYSSGNGEFASFGLTNVATFTGATTEIDYGWRTYGSAANCRKDGDSLNGFINITSGDSLEVRINGATVEYYHNTTLVNDCTLSNQTLSYPYRAAATFTASSAPPISSATMTGMDNLVPPTTLAAANGSGNNIDLSWAYAGAGQSGFKIERKLGKDGTYAEIATVGASTLTYSDTGSKTANRVYAYRVRAYKTGENGPYSAFAQATTPYTGGGSIKTDRAVYAEPTPKPPLPHAGGKWRDEVFGTEIMRATDDDDCGTPGAGTWYNQWPTFNSDNTRILIRCGTSGDMIIKAFDPVNFKLEATLRKTWGGGETQVPMIGGEYARWQGATWSRTDPDKLWVVPLAPNGGGSTSRGPQIYTYSVSANAYSSSPVKSFVSTFTSSQVFFEYHFAGTHSDGDYDVFTASVTPEQNGSAAHWFAWQRTGDRVIFNHDNANVTHYNVCVPSKGGDYIYCGPDSGYTTRKMYRVSDLAEQDLSSAPLSVHGDMGTVWNVARNVQGTLSPQERRTVSDWSNTALTVFDWKDANGVQDSSNDCHTSLAADNEDWVMQGCHDEPAANTPEEAWRETNAFEDEIMQIATDGSQRIRRLVHHRSTMSSSTDYWAAPKPTISLDGRFIAFTSDWEDSGRTDLFILRVPRAPFLSLSDDFNDNSRDAKKWLVNSLGSAASDPNVAVAEQNQRLEITPLSNTSGAHSNGYSTANLIDMTNRRAKVEVVQATNSASWANTVFSLAADNGWYRFLTEHGQLYMEQYVNGSGSGATPITYSSTTHRHWRIRHDPSNDTVYWETSPDGTTWTARHSATRQLDITKLVADLYVRTWQSESSPGVAVFDNFKFEINP